MRVALMVHGLPPHAVTGVETHTEALAGALARMGHQVEVFAPRYMAGLAAYAQRREERALVGCSWAVTWFNAEPHGADADLANAVGAFLDRERPDVVHFQHLLKLGLGAIEEVTRRGLPSLYTAHDFYPIHDTYTLLRPDGESFEAGDVESQARTDRALAFLESLPNLGDPHGTVLRDQLGDAAWSTMRGILEGERTQGLDEARAAVHSRGVVFRHGFARFDRRFATSRHLSRTLSAELGRAVDQRSCGIDLRPFAGATAPDVRERPLRFGFVGGMLQHKGAHIVLEAFARLPRGTTELHLFGDSGDAAYVERVRDRAEQVGARWHGGFQPHRLPQVLESIDVLLIPSLWVENAPFVIREAFAARRPVVASDTPALRESVRDDVDGLLVAQGDLDAWTGALRRFLDESILLERLSRGIESPISIDAEAVEYAATYEELVRESGERKARPVLPAHVEAFAERVAELDGLGTRELFDRVVAGLEVLGGRIGLTADPRTFLARAVGRGSRLRDAEVESCRTQNWLRRTVRSLETARAELERRSGWYAEQLANLEGRVAWYETQVQAAELEQEAIVRERDWLRDVSESYDAERRELRDRLGDVRKAVAALRDERDWLESVQADRANDLHDLRERLVAGAPKQRMADDGHVDPDASDLPAIEAAFESVGNELRALADHETWMRRELASLVRSLSEGAPDLTSAPPLAPEQVDTELQRGRAELARMMEELSWRREEMSVVQRASEGWLGRINATRVAGRARRWDLVPSPTPDAKAPSPIESHEEARS
jgi:glycosyltransferase involved in cell wall biosynthesis